MTDKELVDWLRNCSIYEGRAFLRQAADRIEALEAEVERLTQDHRFFAASVLDFHRVCNANRVHGEVLITGEVTDAFNRLYGHVANIIRAALAGDSHGQ